MTTIRTAATLRTAAENLLSVAACVAAASGDATRYARAALCLTWAASEFDKGASLAGALRAAAEVPVQAPRLDLPPDLVPWDALGAAALAATADEMAGLVRLAPSGSFAQLAGGVLDGLEDLRRRLAASDTARTAVAQHVLASRLSESLAADVA